MTDDSRADRRRLPLFVIAVAFPLAAFQAAAQSEPPATRPSSGPVRLMPRGEPSPPKPRALETPPLAENTRAPSSIEVEGLRAIDPDSVGTLGPAAGGLGADMWSGTQRRFIEMLLPRIPARIESPALRDLARRLLLSVARVPLAEKGRRARKSLIAQRIERLRAIGLVEEAKALLAAAPSRARNPVLVRLSVEQMVIDGDLAGACAEAARNASRRADPDWRRLAVYCQLRDGQTEAAAFGLNVLSESPGFDDPAFPALMDRLGGADDVEVKSLPRPTPLHLAMLRTAKLAVPGDVLKSDSPLILRMVALSDNAGDSLRLRAAERAARLGALTPEELGRIYAAMNFSAVDIERALSIADEESSARARALLFRAAKLQKVATAKAAVLRKAFESARRAGLMALAVRLYKPMLMELSATGALEWFAGDATRALLAADAVEAARPWLLMIRQRALRDASARRLRDGLWALAALAREGGAEAEAPASMKAWFDRLEKAGGGTAAAKADLALSLMQALGVYPPEGFHERILALPPGKGRASVAPPGVLQALADAAAHGRRGEAVALALIAFDGSAPAEAGPELLAQVVKALGAVGLAQDAQALALEAASAAGL